MPIHSAPIHQSQTTKTHAMHHVWKTALVGLAMVATLLPASVSAADVMLTEMTQAQPTSGQAVGESWKTVTTQAISAKGICFAYRELGEQNGGTPVVFLAHLAAVLDN